MASKDVKFGQDARERMTRGGDALTVTDGFKLSELLHRGRAIARFHVKLQQLQSVGGVIRIIYKRVFQQVDGLGEAPVCNVDFRFSERIVGIVRDILIMLGLAVTALLPRRGGLLFWRLGGILHFKRLLLQFHVSKHITGSKWLCLGCISSLPAATQVEHAQYSNRDGDQHIPQVAEKAR